MSAFWDYLAIFLETLGFFMVTTDLYGEKRLRELHDKLAAVKIDGVFAILEFMDKTKVFSTILFFTTLIALMVGLYHVPYHVEFLEHHTIVKFLIFALLDGIVSYYGLYILYLLIFIFIGFIVTVIEKCVRLLHSHPLKNYMLLIGATLFVLSKIIAVVKVH